MRILTFIISTVLLLSCSMNKELKTELITVTDSQGKFSIELPQNWKKDYHSNNHCSGIFSSDTLAETKDVIVVDATWDNSFFEFNSHVNAFFDSLHQTSGLTTQLHKTGKLNDYDSYLNVSVGFDSISDIAMTQYLYLIKSDSLSGHVSFRAVTYGDTIQMIQSRLIADIVKSIEIKNN